jgi:hypothetical protein
MNISCRSDGSAWPIYAHRPPWLSLEVTNIHPPLIISSEQCMMTYQQNVLASPTISSISARGGRGVTSPPSTAARTLSTASSTTCSDLLLAAFDLVAVAVLDAEEGSSWAGLVPVEELWRCASHWRMRSRKRGPAHSAMMMWKGARDTA